MEISAADRAVESETISHLTIISELLAAEIEMAYRQGEPYKTQASLIRLSSDLRLIEATLLDNRYTVRYSTKIASKDDPIEQTVLADSLHFIESIGNRYSRDVHFINNRTHALALHTVLLRDAGQLLPSETGVLALLYDISKSKEDAITSANRTFLLDTTLLIVFCILIGLAAHMYLARRIQFIVNSASKLEKGGNRGESSWWNDELSYLSQSVNGMIERIHEQSESRQESEQHYRNLFDDSPIALWEFDQSIVRNKLVELGIEDDRKLETYLDENPEFLDQCIKSIRELDINIAAMTLYGREKIPDKDMKLTSILGKEPAKFFKDLFVAFWAKSNEFQANAIHSTFDKRSIHVIVHATIAPGHESDWSKVLVSALDITEQREAELALQQRDGQLQHIDKMEAIGRLAGGIAHDFNNMLQVIEGYSTMVSDSLADSDEQQANLHEITNATERAGKLVGQLLTFSRNHPMELQPLDANALLSNLLSLLERTIGAQMKLETHLDDNLPMIIADATHIEQSVVNLVLNAKDASTDGGTIEIGVVNRMIHSDFCAKNAEAREGNFVEIYVSDHGTGMTPDTLKRIFEPFFTTKNPDEGTGLGLSSLYNAIKRQNGFITVESQLGVGSVFRLFFPVADAVRPNIKEDSAENTQHAQVKTVLLAEDETMVRHMMHKVLLNAGYHVLVAEDGIVAIDYLDSNEQISIVILDVIMPNIGGVQVYKAMRERNLDIPVLFLSGYSFDDFSKDILENPSTAFLQKPCPRQKLLHAIEMLLDNQSN